MLLAVDDAAHPRPTLRLCAEPHRAAPSLDSLAHLRLELFQAECWDVLAPVQMTRSRFSDELRPTRNDRPLRTKIELPNRWLDRQIRLRRALPLAQLGAGEYRLSERCATHHAEAALLSSCQGRNSGTDPNSSSCDSPPGPVGEVKVPGLIGALVGGRHVTATSSLIGTVSDVLKSCAS